jgi:type I restriction-modification system DNA methylase subunit
MAHDRQNARQQIEKLIQFFDSNIYQFKSFSFNETQARQQLIDPFFESLGWDVHNRSMKPLFRQEVVPESRVKSSVAKEVKEQEPLFPKKETLGKEYKEYASILDYIAEDEYKANSKEAVKKPDYRFRIGGQTKFFVEAKKPYIDLAKSQSVIFQVKRYGFSGRVPLAILTNFEEFRAFDCTQRPAFEKPKLGIIHDFDLTYKHYLDQFDCLYETFSRDAVASGSLETLTKKMMLKRTGDFALDREFLEDLSKWREELARDIAKHPKNRRLLNDYTLNEAVQRILDRIVFIRVCEDREIEVENTLLAILRMWKERPGLSLYSLLNDLFKQRRALYNGLLFSPHPCEELEIGNEVLIKILENLNYPFSPYHFNEIGVEILGSIYEKFLGKTIHLAPKNVVIKEKPEVRKAGGVYYTPQYIVKYIVDNTLGKLLYEEKTVAATAGRGKVKEPTSTTSVTEIKLKLSPKQAAKLKIIDIACGSGSFLLGAFQKLIDYHIEWYTAHPEDIKTENNVPDAYKDTEGNYHLSPLKKRDILVNNIYGVDIDRQAVEVTQMSLYLKMLEGENAETLNSQMTLALKEVYLPSLAKNIKCGNSLIGTDFTLQGALFDEEARRKVNSFDWEMEFPEILGSKQIPSLSPPYKGGDVRRTEGVEGSRGFDVVIGNPPWIDIKGLEPSLVDYYFKKYKTTENRMNVYAVFIERALNLIKDKGRFGYIIPNSILTQSTYSKLRKKILTEGAVEQIVRLPDCVFEKVVAETIVLIIVIRKVMNDDKCEIIIFNRTEKLDSIDLDKTLKHSCVKQKGWSNGDYSTFNIFSNADTLQLIDKLSKVGSDLETVCDFSLGLTPYDKYKGHTQAQIEKRAFHSTKKKNKTFKKILSGEDISRYLIDWGRKEWISYGEWLGAPREQRFFTEPRLLVRQIVSGSPLRIYAGYTKEELYNAQIAFNLLLRKDVECSLKYILGILNSNLINYYHKHKYLDQSKEVFQKILIQNAKRLPIRTIVFNNPVEKKMHDDLVSLVEKMLELNKQLQKAHFDSEKEPIERQIAAMDKKIDELVYKIYGLTEEEIKIVEGKL